MDGPMISEVLDRLMDDRVCGHPGLFREGAVALCAALCEAADDLRQAAKIVQEGEVVEVAEGLLYRVASEVQTVARTVEIARRTSEALRA